MSYQQTRQSLIQQPRTWLITGVAGFIGSNLLQALLELEQRVVGIDNFSTGYQRNLDEVRTQVKAEQWQRFNFHEGDICKLEDCRKVLEGVDHVLHQAALGSVPRSIENPINTNASNIDGFLNMLVSSKDAAVKSFTYAASSSTYGDHPALPKVEQNIGNPLSPYAVTKYVNELYANVFSSTYGFHSIGLRYFNVFGKRQDPDGAYAAVIPKWIAALLRGEQVFINGDGETSRDFCFIENVVQMNILAATTDLRNDRLAQSEVYNVALGDRTTLNQLFDIIVAELQECSQQTLEITQAEYRDFRKGDVRHSQADISKAKAQLDYQPSHNLKQGIQVAMPWYVSFESKS